MLEGEELDELVDDIRDNGLRQRIVLDTAGQLIDGRNRLKACELAGVEPIFTTVDTDPIAYILSLNVNRRHLSKGQRAMAVAMAYPEPEKLKRKGLAKFSEETSKSDVSKARFVLRHAPDIAAKVMAGSPSLKDAYNHATTKKQEQDEYEQLRKQTQDGVDPIAGICAHLTSNIEKWETAFWTRTTSYRQVHVDAKQIIEHATALIEILALT